MMIKKNDRISKLKKFKFQKTLPIFLIFFGFFSNLNAQNFRVGKNNEIQLSSNSEILTKTLGINDSLTILIPEEKEYIQGVAIEVKIPQLATVWRDSMEWSIYSTLTPEPAENEIDFSGNPVKSGLLPSRLSWQMAIPLTEQNTIKKSPYITKIDAFPEDSKYVFFRLRQVMKGTPEEFEYITFEVSVKPILRNLGKLKVELINSEYHPNVPENASLTELCSIFLDNEPIEFLKDGCYVDSGIHTFSLISEYYRSEVRTIQIDPAKTTNLSIQLRSIEPMVTISAPASATVYFDKNLIEERKSFTIDEGEHIVKFLIGNYETEKKFTAVRGQSYNISLNIEAEISEEE